MKLLVLTLAFTALAVRSAVGQSCDTSKITDCLNSFTSAITQDSGIVQDQNRLCPLFQDYVDCLLNDACQGVSLPDSVKQQVESSLSNYNFNCDINFGSGGGSGGAAGLAGMPYYVTMILAAVGTFFAL